MDDKQRSVAPRLVRSTFHSTFACTLAVDTDSISYIVIECVMNMIRGYARYNARSNNRTFVLFSISFVLGQKRINNDLFYINKFNMEY